MVDVTKDNFSNLLCEFRTAVRGCDFVAVDCEFSGLDDTICRNNFDIPQLRYRRCRKDVNVYTPIQIGLTTFAYNSETSSYTARPFNFYIFPNGNPRFQPQCNIVCNTASLMFLVNQKFNLNKMVLKGIPFLSIEKEIELVEKVNAVTRKGA